MTQYAYPEHPRPPSTRTFLPPESGGLGITRWRTKLHSRLRDPSDRVSRKWDLRRTREPDRMRKTAPRQVITAHVPAGTNYAVARIRIRRAHKQATYWQRERAWAA